MATDTEISLDDPNTRPTTYWHRLDDGRIQCDVCPRNCRLHEGQRGLCFVRARVDDQIVLTSYGRSSGFCIDPVEKKPLNHFLPGSAVLSFGTQAGTKPPRFVLFASGFIEAGYRRFIERRLREEFGFDGTPIHISVRVREKRGGKKN